MTDQRVIQLTGNTITPEMYQAAEALIVAHHAALKAAVNALVEKGIAL